MKLLRIVPLACSGVDKAPRKPHRADPPPQKKYQNTGTKKIINYFGGGGSGWIPSL